VLIFSCAFTPVARALTAITDTNVGTAATAWATDPTTAGATYGNIGDWDVSAVSNMYQLFYSKSTLNDDIGKWNVASVSNMLHLRHGRRAGGVPRADVDVEGARGVERA
jgi:hypothetical protein